MSVKQHLGSVLDGPITLHDRGMVSGVGDVEGACELFSPLGPVAQVIAGERTGI